MLRLGGVISSVKHINRQRQSV